MKKKQLFAVLLAGSMTVGMAPAAAFAAEDTGAVTIPASEKSASHGKLHRGRSIDCRREYRNTR